MNFIINRLYFFIENYIRFYKKIKNNKKTEKRLKMMKRHYRVKQLYSKPNTKRGSRYSHF